MIRYSLPSLLVAALVVAGGLTGCAETQRMINDAGRIADGAGTVASAGGMVTTTAASWTMDATDIRDRSGTFAYDCPPTDNPNSGSVWGSNPYTSDSRVCKAGVHAGVITARGGRVLIQSRPGQNRYAGSTRNGVRTSDYGAYGSSFAVVTN